MVRQSLGKLLLGVVFIMVIAFMVKACRVILDVILPFVGMAAIIFTIYIIFFKEEK